MILWYAGIGIVISSYSLWLILWKDAMETRKKKRKSISLDKITLGGMLLFIASFVAAAAIWPFMALMCMGMTWEVFDWGNLVIYQKKEKPTPSVKDLEKKASKMGFNLTPKELNLEGIDDVTDTKTQNAQTQ